MVTIGLRPDGKTVWTQTLLKPSMDSHSKPNRTDAKRYVACLVRLWRDGPDHIWHASVQAVQSKEVLGFASLETLFAYLKAQTIDDRNVNSEGDTHSPSSSAPDQPLK